MRKAFYLFIAYAVAFALFFVAAAALSRVADGLGAQ